MIEALATVHESAVFRELREPKIKVDVNKCNGCGNCVIVCPINNALNSVEIQGGGWGIDSKLILDIETGKACVFNPELCNNCGACITACARGAISIREYCTKLDGWRGELR